MTSIAENDQERLSRLERTVAQQANLIDKLQNELRKAARFQHDDPDKLLAGIQVFLERASEVKGREKGRRR